MLARKAVELASSTVHRSPLDKIRLFMHPNPEIEFSFIFHFFTLFCVKVYLVHKEPIQTKIRGLLDSRAGFFELGHKLGVIEDTARNLAGESVLVVKRQAELCT